MNTAEKRGRVWTDRQAMQREGINDPKGRPPVGTRTYPSQRLLGYRRIRSAPARSFPHRDRYPFLTLTRIVRPRKVVAKSANIDTPGGGLYEPETLIHYGVGGVEAKGKLSVTSDEDMFLHMLLSRDQGRAPAKNQEPSAQLKSLIMKGLVSLENEDNRNYIVMTKRGLAVATRGAGNAIPD